MDIKQLLSTLSSLEENDFQMRDPSAQPGVDKAQAVLTKAGYSSEEVNDLLDAIVNSGDLDPTEKVEAMLNTLRDNGIDPFELDASSAPQESVVESAVAECPMENEGPEMQSDKPTMDVTMNASSADSIRQLLDVLSNFDGETSSDEMEIPIGIS